MFGMGTGGSSSLGSPRSRLTTGSNIDGRSESQMMLRYMYVCSRDYGQAERAISNGQLNALLRLHIRPIKLVVFQCPS